MFNFSKVSSLALGLALIGGLGLSNLATASTQASHNQTPQQVAEGGADRLQELRERFAEGGADRLQELRERVALAPSNAVRGGVVVAENRAEFGSKYQRY